MRDARGNIRRICGEAVAEKCRPLLGLDKEGEPIGSCRDLGVTGLWYFMGTYNFECPQEFMLSAYIIIRHLCKLSIIFKVSRIAYVFSLFFAQEIT
jgi:hypothetical protein